MSPLLLWWEKEAGSADAMLVDQVCEEHGYDSADVKYKLFDMAVSSQVRLAWKEHVDTPEKVLEILGKAREEAWMFYDMHRETFREKEQFIKFLGLNMDPEGAASKGFIKAALVKVAGTSSIYCVNLMQDLMSLGDYFDSMNKEDMRVNLPGTISNKNWSNVLPLPLEEFMDMEINGEIHKINKDANRV